MNTIDGINRRIIQAKTKIVKWEVYEEFRKIQIGFKRILKLRQM